MFPPSDVMSKATATTFVPARGVSMLGKPQHSPPPSDSFWYQPISDRHPSNYHESTWNTPTRYTRSNSKRTSYRAMRITSSRYEWVCWLTTTTTTTTWNNINEDNNYVMIVCNITAMTARCENVGHLSAATKRRPSKVERCICKTGSRRPLNISKFAHLASAKFVNVMRPCTGVDEWLRWPSVRQPFAHSVAQQQSFGQSLTINRRPWPSFCFLLSSVYGSDTFSCSLRSNKTLTSVLEMCSVCWCLFLAAVLVRCEIDSRVVLGLRGGFH